MFRLEGAVDLTSTCYTVAFFWPSQTLAAGWYQQLQSFTVMKSIDLAASPSLACVLCSIDVQLSRRCIYGLLLCDGAFCRMNDLGMTVAFPHDWCGLALDGANDE